MHPIKKHLKENLSNIKVGDPELFKLPNDIFFFCVPLINVMSAQWVTGFYSKKGGVTDLLIGSMYVGSILSDDDHSIFIGINTEKDGSFFKFIDNEWIPIDIIGSRKII